MKINDYSFEEKQNALDEAHVIMNPVDEMNAVQIYATKDMHRRRVRLSTESIDYLIEQAERVPKLELNFKSLQQEWVNTVKEKRRLREALEFYANVETYKTNVVNQWEPIIPVNRDGGELARQTLKGVDRNGETWS